ncbi:hypothetical protein C6N75_05490 [Streptomyces solincola]|uniref:Tat pathway signal sequence domain protein n=1 Tax=Streptomyces solincola TaxID=2100817 RepID=A0A2S9Q0N7_9ACTN|nr:hypothetical protein [Streptomyces solincola]PRH80208.1 hypothetical protein C6N75_05490 [Streptomyces solincola]
MIRAGLVAAAAAALVLGPAAPGFAATTTTGDVSAPWGDRARVEFTWTDRTAVEGGTLTVSDLTCDDAPVYAVVTALTGSGATIPLATTARTAGCGQRAERTLTRVGDAAGIRQVTLSLCRPATGAAGAACVTPYRATNPYGGFGGLRF